MDMMTMTNTVDASNDDQCNALVGLDALEAGNLAVARKLLINAPVTVEIGTNRLAGRITKVTKCVITVVYGYGDQERTFRKPAGWTIWNSKGYYFLSFGEAVTELDMCS